MTIVFRPIRCRFQVTQGSLVRPKPSSKVIQWVQQIPNEALFLSVLSLGEIRKSVEGIIDSKRKEKIRLWLEVELPEWFGERILTLDKTIADRWGRLQYEMKRPIPAVDSLIAATALSYDLRMVTRNKADFAYPGLEVINPWEK